MHVKILTLRTYLRWGALEAAFVLRFGRSRKWCRLRPRHAQTSTCCEEIVINKILLGNCWMKPNFCLTFLNRYEARSRQRVKPLYEETLISVNADYIMQLTYWPPVIFLWTRMILEYLDWPNKSRTQITLRASFCDTSYGSTAGYSLQAAFGGYERHHREWPLRYHSITLPRNWLLC